jgi:hypothetical protein
MKTADQALTDVVSSKPILGKAFLKSEPFAILYARFALGAAFLSAVAARFGICGSRHWDTQPEIIKSAGEFDAQGGRLLRLEFKDTKIQRYGDVAMLYTRYLYKIQTKSKRSVTSGRVTEIVVFRNGKWLNPGWHTDNKG